MDDQVWIETITAAVQKTNANGKAPALAAARGVACGAVRVPGRLMTQRGRSDEEFAKRHDA